MPKLEQFIISHENTRGEGKFPSLIRGITQIYTTDGKLVATHDPYTLTLEQIIELFPKDPMKMENRESLIGLLCKRFNLKKTT